MKRLIVLFPALLFTTVLFAEPVGRDDAKLSARAFLAERGIIMKSTEAPYRAPRKGKTTEDTPYYIFNVGNEQGYVIVSGDDRTPEILGYVDQGSFNESDIPENMRSLLQLYADEIESLNTDETAGSQSRKQTRRAKFARRSISPLVKSKWNQGSPYNLSCPDYIKKDTTYTTPKTGRPAAGCVATAFAQIINFYKYPAKTKATIPSHSNKYKYIFGSIKDNATTGKKDTTYIEKETTVTTAEIPRGTVIDWENMCDTYGGGETEAQRKAVADLMLMCGQAVKMGYGASSGASTSSCKNAIKDYFGFDDSAIWVSRSNYDLEDWMDLLYSELDKGYPICYSGQSTGGGHAFVIDGFDGEGLFHVNWGWGGGSNGWFVITSLNSGDNSGLGASTTTDGYSMSQGAMIQVRLPDNKKPTDGVKLSVTNITCNGGIATVTFKSTNEVTNSYTVAIGRYDEETDTYKPVGIGQSVTNMAKDATASYKFNVNKRLTYGTYYLTPISRVSSSSVWLPAFSLNRFNTEYILAEVDSTGNTKLQYVKRESKLSLNNVTFPGTCTKGKEQPVMVTFDNLGGEFYGTMALYAGKNGAKEYQKSKAAISIPADGSATVAFNFTPSATGVYDVWICDGDGKKDYAHATVNISTTSSASLQVTSVTIQNSSGGVVYSNRLQGTLTIKNNLTKPFQGKVKIQIWYQPKGSSTATSSSSRLVDMSIRGSGSASASFAFDNLRYDRYYRLVVSSAEQGGTLDNGNLWNDAHKYEPTPGVIYWKNKGEIACAMGAGSSFLNTPNAAVGVYLNGTKVTHLYTNDSNPNIIYMFADNTTLPTFLTEMPHVNKVYGSSADSICLQPGYPYYVPFTFRAQAATFSYTFPENTDGTFWQTVMIPFESQEILLDSTLCKLSDADNHFWIYELLCEDAKGMPKFRKATKVHPNVPYLIAADATLAGKTIHFEGSDVDIYRNGDIKNMISTDHFQFQSSTLMQSVKGAYHLNASGTAFEYVEKATSLQPLAGYFTTNYSAEERPDSIPLPAIPAQPTAIKMVKATLSDGMLPVYNISGQRVGTSTVSSGIIHIEGLKPGVYIVGGKKVLVK